MTVGARRGLWLLWWMAWALITLPWGALERHPHWQRVEWVPFQASGRRPALDAALNLAFFVPFGYLAAGSGLGAGAVLASAATVSVLTETVQVYASSRYPSATDVVVNIAGAGLGLAAATARRRRPRPPAP